jgi:hypothetical protein
MLLKDWLDLLELSEKMKQRALDSADKLYIDHTISYVKQYERGLLTDLELLESIVAAHVEWAQV